MPYQSEAAKYAANIGLGIRIERTDLASVAWAAGPVSLFTITGGDIIVNLMRQEVTGLAVNNEAGTILYSETTAAPFAVANVNFSTASASVALAAIGATITVVGTALATAALRQTTIGPQLIGRAASLILHPGIVCCENTGVVVTGPATCYVKTQMWYFPLSAGTQVVCTP